MAQPLLAPEALFKQLGLNLPDRQNTRSTYLVAYSGGLDSHVLLHLFAAMAQKYPHVQLRSIYIDHGLQTASSAWASHCESTTSLLGINHQTVKLHIKIPKGESLEAVARKARYRAFKEQLQPHEILLTAHHQDDQAETVLLQLLRGSGLDGLAAMAKESVFADGYHVRPLLPYSREQLEQYAQAHNLTYITDHTNGDSRFDRNYLRHHVVPLLKKRWPQMGVTLSRSAQLQAEASQLQAFFLSEKMALLRGKNTGTLSVSALKKAPYLKQKALLRYWIKRAGYQAPSAAQLEQIITDVLGSKQDAMPLVEWGGTQVRRYKDDIYIMPSLLPVDIPKEALLHWDLNFSLFVSEGAPTLNPEDLGDLKNILLRHRIPVTVRFRQGGERIRLRGRQCSISLKHVFQEKNIPPWLRERMPLVFAADQLIYIPGVALIDQKDLDCGKKSHYPS